MNAPWGLQQELPLGAGAFAGTLYQNTTAGRCGYVASEGKFEYARRLEPADLISQAEACERVGLTDCYVTMQSFRPFADGRLASNVTQVNAYAVDLDYAKTEYADLEAEDFIALVLNQNPGLPWPSVVMSSGTGVWLYWVYKRPPPVTKRFHYRPVWQQHQDHLISLLAPYGADSACRDMSRFTRVPGTVNSKNDATARAWGTGKLWDFTELNTLIEQLAPTPSHKKPPREKPTRKQIDHVLVEFKKTGYTLADARMQDMRKLCELRGGTLTDMRSRMGFAYLAQAVFFCGSSRDLEQECETFFRAQFHNPEKYVQRLSGGGHYREAMRRMEAWLTRRWANPRDPDRGLLVDETQPFPYYHKDNPYFFSNRRLIQMLDITPKEQRHMKTLIGGEEKRKRKQKRDEKRRRAQGQVPRDEYLGTAEERREQVLRLRADGVSIRAIAEQLRCSPGTVHRDLKVSVQGPRP